MWILYVNCKKAKISRRKRKIAIITFIAQATIITCTIIHMATITIITGITQTMKGQGTKISIIKRATKTSKNKQRTTWLSEIHQARSLKRINHKNNKRKKSQLRRNRVLNLTKNNNTNIIRDHPRLFIKLSLEIIDIRKTKLNTLSNSSNNSSSFHHNQCSSSQWWTQKSIATNKNKKTHKYRQSIARSFKINQINTCKKV